MRAVKVDGSVPDLSDEAITNRVETIRLDPEQVKRCADIISGNLTPEFEDLFAHDASLKEIVRVARNLAPLPHPLCISGATGSGRTTLAQAIHSSTRDLSSLTYFDALNPDGGSWLAEGPDNSSYGILLGDQQMSGRKRVRLSSHEAEERLRSADESIEGQLRRAVLAANEGTLIIKNFDALSLSVQSKLLSILPGSGIRPSDHCGPYSARIIFICEGSLEEGVRNRILHPEVAARLRSFELAMPSLADTPKRLAAIWPVFLAAQFESAGNAPATIDAAAREVMERAPWRGNLLELQQFTAALAARSNGEPISTAFLNALRLTPVSIAALLKERFPEPQKEISAAPLPQAAPAAAAMQSTARVPASIAPVQQVHSIEEFLRESMAILNDALRLDPTITPYRGELFGRFVALTVLAHKGFHFLSADALKISPTALVGSLNAIAPFLGLTSGADVIDALRKYTPSAKAAALVEAFNSHNFKPWFKILTAKPVLRNECVKSASAEISKSKKGTNEPIAASVEALSTPVHSESSASLKQIASAIITTAVTGVSAEKKALPPEVEAEQKVEVSPASEKTGKYENTSVKRAEKRAAILSLKPKVSAPSMPITSELPTKKPTATVHARSPKAERDIFYVDLLTDAQRQVGHAVVSQSVEILDQVWRLKSYTPKSPRSLTLREALVAIEYGQRRGDLTVASSILALQPTEVKSDLVSIARKCNGIDPRAGLIEYFRSYGIKILENVPTMSRVQWENRARGTASAPAQTATAQRAVANTSTQAAVTQEKAVRPPVSQATPIKSAPVETLDRVSAIESKREAIAAADTVRRIAPISEHVAMHVRNEIEESLRSFTMLKALLQKEGSPQQNLIRYSSLKSALFWQVALNDGGAIVKMRTRVADDQGFLAQRALDLKHEFGSGVEEILGEPLEGAALEGRRILLPPRVSLTDLEAFLLRETIHAFTQGGILNTHWAANQLGFKVNDFERRLANHRAHIADAALTSRLEWLSAVSIPQHYRK